MDRLEFRNGNFWAINTPNHHFTNITHMYRYLSKEIKMKKKKQNESFESFARPIWKINTDPILIYPNMVAMETRTVQ